ncbi:hypothetical protein CSOJ01_16130, partial [Colletotrichum sojae]
HAPDNQASNTYPGFSPGAAERQQYDDDDGSVNHATADNGCTHNRETDAGERPAAPTDTSSVSESPILIDFSGSADTAWKARIKDLEDGHGTGGPSGGPTTISAPSTR